VVWREGSVSKDDHKNVVFAEKIMGNYQYATQKLQ
jgi:hypothetical protein